MRLFIGLAIAPLPELTRQVSLLKNHRSLRVVESDNLHLTLKFLGETDDRQAAAIPDLLDQLACEISPEPLVIRGLGAFPNGQRPSVLWAGVERAAWLIKTAARLEERCEHLGFAPEGRPYHPHVTLARVKDRLPEELQNQWRHGAEILWGTVPVSPLTLYLSELNSEGSRYTVRHAARWASTS